MLDDELKEHGKAMGVGLVWWIFIGTLVLATMLGVGLVVAEMTPWFTKKDTENTRQSDQYITTKQAAIRELRTNWDVLDTRQADLRQSGNSEDLIRAIDNQKAGLVRQMREQADLIPGHVPADLKSFINNH